MAGVPSPRGMQPEWGQSFGDLEGSGGWGMALRILTTFWLGLSLIVALITALTTAFLLGSGLGIAGLLGALVAFLLALLLGRIAQAAIRHRFHREAFAWCGAAADAHPISDFSVRKWYGSDIGSEIPQYVPRAAAQEIHDGLINERFVIVVGPRLSGKSRLIYEVLKELPEVVLVSRSLLEATQPQDPLISLMSDHVGYWASDHHQTLLVRSCAPRLLAGSINADLVRRWLDRHQTVSLIVTFNDKDLSDISAGGEDVQEAFGRLKEEARVVSLSEELSDSELKVARELYPDLTEHQRRVLPRYLSLAEPLEKRFIGSASDEHALGHAITRAAADWARAGISRPAPERYLRAAVPFYLPDADLSRFEEELGWCTEPLENAASLLYRGGNGEEPGLIADRLICDLIDRDKHGRWGSDIPGFALMAICEELGLTIEEAGRIDPVEDLIAVQESVRRRGGPDLTDWFKKLIPELDTNAQRRRLVDQIVDHSQSGSVRSLIRTRIGDGIYRRLTSIQRLASPPRPATAPRFGFLDRVFARIYVYRTVRALARFLVLVSIDALCASLGFLAGFGLVFAFGSAPHADWAEAFARVLVTWTAITVGVAALCGLYREDSPRAQLPALLLAASVLGFIGLAVAIAQGIGPGVAATSSIVGAAVIALTDNWLRTQYDHISRRWVIDHGLVARTLLIGSDELADRAHESLSDMSRPTEVIGHLSLHSDDSSSSLGTISQLPAIAHQMHVGRVVILEPAISTHERQMLADYCHAEGLLVEAIPTLSDIQAGGSEFVLGQSAVLVRLEPLWQRSPGFFVKRVFDFIVALCAITILLPILAALLIIVRLDCGRPLVIRSWRLGAGGKTFGMFRFRTSDGPIPSPFDIADFGDDQSMTGTAMGKRLRRRGLDELPQLFNVLLGQMSIIGPRPLPLKQHLELNEEDLRRYVVRPGLTGAWQVCGRTTLSYGELTRLDLSYLRQWSLFTDIAILAKSLRVMLLGRPKFPHLRPARQQTTNEPYTP